MGSKLDRGMGCVEDFEEIGNGWERFGPDYKTVVEISPKVLLEVVFHFSAEVGLEFRGYDYLF